jgi:hypothetical protein
METFVDMSICKEKYGIHRGFLKKFLKEENAVL